MADTNNLNTPDSTNEADSEPRLTVLDSEGDVTMVIIWGNGVETFIKCCSRILTLASPVFSKQLSAHCSKAFKPPDTMIELEEEHPSAMVQMLCLLHHSDPLDFKVNPQDIAAVAIQSRKYECEKALRAWGEFVCRQCSDRGITDPVEIGHLILAAHLFNLSAFDDIVIIGLKNLPPGFQSEWQKDAIMRHLPPDITRWVEQRICKLLVDLQTKVYRMEGRVRANRNYWPLLASTTGRKYCMTCGRAHPSIVMNCYRCNLADLTKDCPPESRSAAYLNNLEVAGLWPSPTAFTTLSVAQLVNKISCLSDISVPHEHACRAGLGCSLRLAYDGLHNICKIYLEGLSVPAGVFSSRQSGSP